MNPAWQAIEDEWVRREQAGELMIRGHALGYCIRRLVLDQFEMPVKPYTKKTNQAFADSLAWEQVVVDWMGNITDAQKPCTLDIPQHRAFVALHPDGFYEENTWQHPRVVEIKSFGQPFYDKFQREGLRGFPEYEWQVSAEMYATGLPALLVVALKGGTERDLIIRNIDQAPCDLRDIEERVGKVRAEFDAAERFGVQLYVDQQNCSLDAKSWGCPYWHLGKCPKPVEEYKGREAVRLEQWATWLDRAKERQDQAAADVRKWQEKIKAAMDEAGQKKVVTATHEITVVADSKSKQIDIKLLRNTEPEHYETLLEEYGRNVPRRGYVKVKPRTGDDDGRGDGGQMHP